MDSDVELLAKLEAEYYPELKELEAELLGKGGTGTIRGDYSARVHRVRTRSRRASPDRKPLPGNESES